jgi:hypothetical protein
VIGVDELVLAGTGVADAPRPDLIDRRARAIIRYADPAAWITAAAVAQAMARANDRVDPWRHEIGLAVVSDHGPRETMDQVQAAADEGFSSPLRYAAANPGSLAGVACIAFGLRGPTLNLTMPPREGIPIVILVAREWLARGIARAMVLAVFSNSAPAAGSARAVLVGSKTVVGAGDDFAAPAAQWLGCAAG